MSGQCTHPRNSVQKRQAVVCQIRGHGRPFAVRSEPSSSRGM